MLSDYAGLCPANPTYRTYPTCRPCDEAFSRLLVLCTHMGWEPTMLSDYAGLCPANPTYRTYRIYPTCPPCA